MGKYVVKTESSKSCNTSTCCNLLRYRHIRTGERSVREEYYKLANELNGVYHMSHWQIENAIVLTANQLFGRQWKVFDDNPDVIDCNTLPHKKNNRRTGLFK